MRLLRAALTLVAVLVAAPAISATSMIPRDDNPIFETPGGGSGGSTQCVGIGGGPPFVFIDWSCFDGSPESPPPDDSEGSDSAASSNSTEPSSAEESGSPSNSTSDDGGP